MLTNLQAWAPQLLAGLVTTVGMTFGAMAIALVFALLLALGRISANAYILSLIHI